MRTILSLGLALVISGGVTMLTGCEKKATSEHKTTDVSKTPGGGEKKVETEQKVTETPDKDKK